MKRSILSNDSLPHQPYPDLDGIRPINQVHLHTQLQSNREATMATSWEVSYDIHVLKKKDDNDDCFQRFDISYLLSWGFQQRFMGTYPVY